MKKSKYIFDSWFDELFDELRWDQVCQEQENYNKAVDLATNFFSSERDFEFAQKWIFHQKPKNKFFYLCKENES